MLLIDQECTRSYTLDKREGRERKAMLIQENNNTRPFFLFVAFGTNKLLYLLFLCSKNGIHFRARIGRERERGGFKE